MAFAVDPLTEASAPPRVEGVWPKPGDGYLAGEFPGGITTVDNAPVSASVRVLFRPQDGAPGDGIVVAEVLSSTSGTWRVDGLNTALKYDVVGRKAGFNDVIKANVSPALLVGSLDPQWPKVSLLLHMDTPLVDKSPTPKSIFTVGAATIVDTPKLFGNGSLSLPAPTAYLAIPDHPDFDVADNDFSVQASICMKGPAIPNGDYFVSKYAASGAPDSFTLYATNSGFGFLWRTAPTLFYTVVGGGAPVVGQWYNLAAKRTGDVFTLWLDDVLIGTTTQSGAIQTTTTPVTIGALPGGVYGCNAYIDEVRITNEAREFVVLTEPFPDRN